MLKKRIILLFLLVSFIVFLIDSISVLGGPASIIRVVTTTTIPLAQNECGQHGGTCVYFWTSCKSDERRNAYECDWLKQCCVKVAVTTTTTSTTIPTTTTIPRTTTTTTSTTTTIQTTTTSTTTTSTTTSTTIAVTTTTTPTTTTIQTTTTTTSTTTTTIPPQKSTTYIYANNQRMAKIENDKIYYYHNDPLGSPVAITDGAGNVVWKADYEPFGESFNEVSLDGGNNVMYNSKELDSDTDLLYYGARYYNANIGRFITPDKMEFSDINDPQSLNRYIYVKNNPMKYRDEKGEFALLGAAVGVVLGAGFSIGMDIYQGNNIDWAAAGKSALIGGVSGLYGNVIAGVAMKIAGGVGGGVAGRFVGGAVVGAAEDAVMQYVATGEVKLKQVAVSSLASGIAASVSLPKRAGTSSGHTTEIPTGKKSSVQSSGRKLERTTGNLGTTEAKEKGIGEIYRQDPNAMGTATKLGASNGEVTRNLAEQTGHEVTTDKFGNEWVK